MPQNSGELITQSHISNLRLKKVFELELVNMEGRPCYRLNNKLGFGSQIGEVLIADESISPRHCTFTLEQEVISIIDHNSVSGTLVNDVQIEPGKNLILDESDQIQIGELLIKIKTHNEAVVREKKALLATIPEVENPILEESLEEAEEESRTDYDLVTQLTQLDDKFQDDTSFNIDNSDFDSDSISTSASSNLLVEKGIDIKEIIGIDSKTSSDQEDWSDEEFDLDSVQEFDEEELIEEDEGMDEEYFEEPPEKEKKVSTFYQAFLQKFKKKEEPKPKAKAKVKTGKSFRDRSKNAVVIQKYAANTILRIVALHIDVCFAYGTYLLLSPFDDFKNLVSNVTFQINELLGIIAGTEIYQKHGPSISFLLEMFKDIWNVVDNYINPIPTIIILGLSKLIFTLIFGVSLGQVLVGIKPAGNVVWSRVGGVIRTVIGFFTFPFLIFDLGAVISRRTFKELVTFTRIYSDSKVFNILLSIIFVTVSGLFVLMAPMFQGFEATTRYEIPKRVEERIRVDGHENVEDEITKSFSSRLLGFQAGLSDEFEVFPGFKFEGSERKTKSNFALSIYDKKMEGSSEIELFKSFDIKQLLEIGFKGNPFLKLKFPHIDNFIHQYTPVGFKRSALDSDSFANEFMEFHRMAMDMSIESYFDYIDEVPVVGSLLNYKQSFLSLFEKPEIGSMSFTKIGNIIALKISEPGVRPHDYLIPILPEGKIFKVSFKGEIVSGLASRLYRYALYNSNWVKEVEANAFDKVLLALQNQKEVDINDAQDLYGYYYELAQRVLSKNIDDEYQLLRRSVKSVQLLLDGVSKDSEALVKLDSNFKDLVDAIEIQNLDYFDLKETTLL
ncbi:MAG TPA: FHA domain-containing protein [Bacteriovoracaceae bacterium]|nr:FHA domain-containing protein [Bacteriovoracaceae bacterium]